MASCLSAWGVEAGNFTGSATHAPRPFRRAWARAKLETLDTLDTLSRQGTAGHGPARDPVTGWHDTALAPLTPFHGLATAGAAPVARWHTAEGTNCQGVSGSASRRAQH